MVRRFLISELLLELFLAMFRERSWGWRRLEELCGVGAVVGDTPLRGEGAGLGAMLELRGEMLVLLKGEGVALEPVGGLVEGDAPIKLMR